MRDKNETPIFEKLPVKKARELGERERRMRERKAQRRAKQKHQHNFWLQENLRKA
jgi:hypothetical protein